MAHSSDEEEEQSEISESEVTDCIEKIYSQLQSKRYKVKRKGVYKCPFCPGKKKQAYQFKDLLQHATGIGMSNKHKPKMRAQHQALAKFMKNDLAGPTLVHHVAAVEPAPPPQRRNEEKYVWPWKGILVNLPCKYQDGQYRGKTNDEIKTMISNFNPSDVCPLWDHKGHTGRCIVDFGADWNGFRNAMSFDKHFQSRGAGRLEWREKELKPREVYGWIAMEVDFNKSGLVADHLRKHGVLKSVDDVTREDSSKAGSSVADMIQQIEAKNQDLYEMEYKYNAKALSLAQVMEDSEMITQAYNEESRMLEESFRAHHLSVLLQNGKIRAELEDSRRELDERNRQLTVESSKYEINKQELENERQKRAEFWKQKADEEMLMLVEQQKREKDENLKKILQLQKELEAEQQLKLEIEILKGQLKVMHHMGDDGDLELKEKMDKLKEELDDKIDDLEASAALNGNLVAKERQANDEVTDARKELIQGLEGMLGPRSGIKMRRMGEIDLEVLRKAFRERVSSEDEADMRAVLACSKWQDELKDPNWHPFKIVGPEGKEEEILVDDEKLFTLREGYGQEVYEAVKTALLELNEYNPSGRYTVNEIWKVKEDRKATLKEVICYVLTQVKAARRRKRNGPA